MEQPPLRTHWYTDRGRRPSNEDAVLVEALFGDRDLVAVADGMGGHAGGEVASGKALETLLNVLESSNDLAAAIREANATLRRASEANPEWRGMGTTLVALLRVGQAYYVANVGDSRAYRVDAQGIHRITEDHSFTAEAVSSGRLSEDEAERSPWRNALTRAVGTDAEVEVDVFGPYELEPPHVVVLCTDGLYRVMSDEELGSEVMLGRDRVDGARDLVANALRRGSSDNISVALVEFGDMSALESPDEPATEEAPAAIVRPAASAEPVEAATDVEVPESAAAADPELVEAGVGGEPVDESAEVLEGAVGASDQEAAVDETFQVAASEPESGAEPAIPDGPPSPAQATASTAETSTEAPSQDAVAQAHAPVGDSSSEGDPEAAEPPVEAARVTTPYRKAKPARPRRHRSRRHPRTPRKLPSWVKREAVPAVILVLGTLAIVYVLTSVFG